MIKKIETNKKGGRPPLAAGEHRSCQHKVSYTPTDEDTIEYKAQQSGMSVKRYLHDAPLVKEIRQQDTDLEIELKRQLSQLGNNINQIAYHANREGLMSIKNRCMEVLGQLATVLLYFLHGKKLPAHIRTIEVTNSFTQQK